MVFRPNFGDLGRRHAALLFGAHVDGGGKRLHRGIVRGQARGGEIGRRPRVLEVECPCRSTPRTSVAPVRGPIMVVAGAMKVMTNPMRVRLDRLGREPWTVRV